MTLQDLLPLLVVAGIAGYVGFRFGRATALAETAAAREAPSPLPEPSSRSTPDNLAPRERRSAPPPASAGGGAASGPPASAGGTPPRRSTAPPPAAAGLADLDGSKKR